MIDQVTLLKGGNVALSNDFPPSKPVPYFSPWSSMHLLFQHKMFRIVAIASSLIWARSTLASNIALSAEVPADAAPPIPESFVSYSIEFSSFPDFAGW